MDESLNEANTDLTFSDVRGQMDNNPSTWL